MAKAPKQGVPSKSIKNSSVSKGVSPKGLVATGTPCSCADSENGTIKLCDDGSCRDLPPPTYKGVLVFDPTAGDGFPYWENASAVPAANRTAFMPTVTNLLTELVAAIPTASSQEIDEFKAICVKVYEAITNHKPEKYQSPGTN